MLAYLQSFYSFEQASSEFSSLSHFSYHFILHHLIISSSHHLIMSFASSEDDQIFENLDDLMLRINEHAESQKYACVLHRTKKFKLEVRRKTWIVCDRDRKFKESRDQERRHIFSRRIDFSFSSIVKREDDIVNSWVLKVVDFRHNHEASLAKAHSVLRRLTMISEMRNDISRQLIVQMTSTKILSSLQISNFTTEINFDDSEHFYVINSLFNARDIYNVKIQMRRDVLRLLTSIQALIRELDQDDWTYKLQKDDEDQITHFFFMKTCSLSVLKINFEILIMNCTYKINR